MPNRFSLVEHFHLRLLRGLAQRLSGRSWALKGGVCLRLFHRSPRLSEDMDLDVDPRAGLASIQKAVDSVLGSEALGRALAPLGITAIGFSKPKQTDSTQRWKVRLDLRDGDEAHTKVEISRRRAPQGAVSGVPDPNLLAEHSLPLFASAYYPATAMARQKLLALAAPGRNAARDLFDLHHLKTHAGADLRAALRGLEPKTVPAALDKLRSFALRDWQAQVLPFLPGDLAELYGNGPAFEALRGETAAAVDEALP